VNVDPAGRGERAIGVDDLASSLANAAAGNDAPVARSTPTGRS